MSDVIVTNVRMGTFVINDIGVDVPHGVVVTIPAEKALHSRDLWRGISQRTLFQFHPAAIHKGALIPAQPPSLPPAPPPPTSYQAPETVFQEIIDHGRAMREAVQQRDEVFFSLLVEQQRQTRALQEQLDTALRLLHERPVGAVSAPQARADRPTEAVGGEAPVFIPSTIKPKDIEAHVEVQTESTSENAVSGATSALRKLRQGGSQ